MWGKLPDRFGDPKGQNKREEVLDSVYTEAGTLNNGEVPGIAEALGDSHVTRSTPLRGRTVGRGVCRSGGGGCV